MAPKVLLIDADGVLILSGRPFSHQHADEQGIEAGQIEPFFHGTFRQASVGKADLKELINEQRDLWNWKGTPEELLAKWFKAESNVDAALLEILQQLRGQGVKVYLATDQEKYRAQYLREQVFKDQLDGFFVSCGLGVEKSDPAFFKAVLERLPGVQAPEVLFFDDSQSKVDSALAAGFRAELYTSRQQIEDLLGSPTQS